MTLVLIRHVIMDLPDAPMRGGILRVTSLAFSGMDMFFVMSGFLITGLLYDAKTGPNYLRNYFARRCLRVFPLYYAALIVIFVVVPHLPIALPANYALLLQNQAWYWTYTTNILLATTLGLGTPLHTSHFWSLAVEEQFYLVWPLLLWFLGRRGILRLCVACVAIAIAFRLWLHVYYGGLGVYVLTPGRLDALAIGGLLAILSRDPAGLRGLARRCVWPFWITLAAMAIIVVQEGELNRLDPWNYLAGYTIAAVMWGCLIVMLAANSTPRLARVIGHRIWARLGRHSYGMYIVHYPLLGVVVALLPAGPIIDATGGTIVPTFVLYSLLVWALSYAVAVAVWHGLERRFLDLKRFFPSPPAIHT